MAGFSNVLTGLSLVSNLVDGVSSYNDGRRQDEANVRALQAKQQAEYEQAMADASLKRTEIEQNAKDAEATRQAALKRAVARQRAAFGSSGITPSTSGSAEAVLLGLFEESDEERVSREKLDSLRHQALDNDLAYINRVNVLELDAARERQRIGQTSSLFKTIGSAAGRLD